jgi:hypothetical protein
MQSLDAEQEMLLKAHLLEVLTEDDLRRVLPFLDEVLGIARVQIKHPEEYKAVRKQHYKHMTLILKHARALAALLEVQMPTAQLNHGGYEIFQDRLDFLIHCAERDIESLRVRDGRKGRPSFEWRDSLIATVFHSYPKGKATKTDGSHFQQTIELLLQFLGREVENTHDVLVDALRRHPEPPFEEVVLDQVE